MATNEFRIPIPEGMEIDKENSTFELIKFKLKTPTYPDVVNTLFKRGCGYYIDSYGKIIAYDSGSSMEGYEEYILDDLNAITEFQLEKMKVLNRLHNVALYLNKDWKPNWIDPNQKKYLIRYNKYQDTLDITHIVGHNDNGGVYFKSPELAGKAIDILGKDELKKIFIQ